MSNYDKPFNNSSILHVSLTSEEFKELKSICEIKKISMNYFAVLAIKEKIKEESAKLK